MRSTGDFKETEAKMLSEPSKSEVGNVGRWKEGDPAFRPFLTSSTV